MGTKEEYETRKGKAESDADKKKWWFKKSDPVAKSTGWLVLVTGLLFFATVGLYCATRDLVIDARHTAERQLQAYVFVDSASVANVAAGSTPVIKIIVKNSGQTPAFDLSMRGNIGFAGFPLQERPDLSTYLPSPKRTLPPQAIVNSSQTLSIPLTQQVFDMILASKTAIYLFGEIRYVDAFGKKRWDDFILYVTGPTGISGGVATYEDNSDTNNHESK